MKRLVVCVPGLGGGPGTWQPLVEKLKAEEGLAGAAWLVHDHSCRPFSRTRAFKEAVRITAAIEQRWITDGPFDDIILIGHSAGGLFVRQAYLIGAGEYPEAPSSHPWHRQVSRIVLLAAVNRGVDPAQNSVVRAGVRWAKFLRLFRYRPLVLDLLAGSVNVTDLRIRWIRYFAQLGQQAPVVVQLRGVSDDLVSREDSYDVEQFPNAFHIKVDAARHRDIHRIDVCKEPEVRYAVLKNAILDATPDHEEKPEREAADAVVFIVHGIRDTNLGWVNDLKVRLKDWADSSDATVVVNGPSYGWFTPIDFLFPKRHRRPIRTVQNEYSTFLAKYPNADFHFIGHSNGTHILGEMLKRIRGIRFNRVFLAGSVLPRDYNWNECFRQQQVSRIRNDLACADVPVGVLCSALTGLGRRTIGTAGADGFLQNRDDIAQFHFHDGGHGDAIQEDNYESIIRFILDGDTSKPEEILSGEKTKRFSWFSRLARILSWPLVLAIIGGLGWVFYLSITAGLIVIAILFLLIWIFGETI